MLPGSFLGAACGGLRARASAARGRGRRIGGLSQQDSTLPKGVWFKNQLIC